MSYKCIFAIYPNFEGIQKDGNFKYQYSLKDKRIYNINCLLKNKLLFFETLTYLSHDRNQLKKKNTIRLLKKNKIFLKKEAILEYILFKLKYKIAINNKDFKKHEITYFLYNKKNFDNLVKYIYIKDYIDKKDFKNKYTENIKIFIEYMAIEYYKFNLKYNISDKEFFINIFYRFYIIFLKDEIIKKYGLDISIDFDNYHSIYLFLKEKNYVSTFYKKIKKEIVQEYNHFKIFIKNKKKDINKFKKNIISFNKKLIINNEKILTKQNIKKLNKNIKKLKNNENNENNEK